GAHRCEFCSAALLVRACPRCFARIFHGHVHCPHCGVVVEKPAQADPDGTTHARACPACKERQALTARLVGEVLIDECTSCYGIWLDAAAVERVIRERGDKAIIPLRELGMTGRRAALDTGGAAAAAPPSRAMYLPCPDCGTIMNRVNFGRRSGIIIDTCKSHGTWFDDGELPRVVEFVLEGGLEEAQRRELEEMREAARRAKAEAEAARSAGAALSMPASRHETHVELFGGA